MFGCSDLSNGTFLSLQVHAYTMNITPYTGLHQLTTTQHAHISELGSLAVKPNQINELNNYEIENLVNSIKQTMFQDYKSAFSRL